MKIMAINGSPREKGNTSTILEAILEGARESGAETTHVWLDRIDLKGCMGCLACREKPGFCQRQDELAPYLEAMKTGHVDSHVQPAWKDPVLLEKARQVGRRLALR